MVRRGRGGKGDDSVSVNTKNPLPLSCLLLGLNRSWQIFLSCC